LEESIAARVCVIAAWLLDEELSLGFTAVESLSVFVLERGSVVIALVMSIHRCRLSFWNSPFYLTCKAEPFFEVTPPPAFAVERTA
jgi:hypothetical protein